MRSGADAGPTLLFLCGGRRVGLLRRFRGALDERGGGRLLTTDTEERAATTFVADRTFVVPPCGSEAFVDAVAKLCEAEGVTAVLPLRCVAMPDLPPLRQRISVPVVCGDDEAIRVCTDKLATARHLTAAGVPTAEVVADPTPEDLPLFFRHRRSEGSQGASRIDTAVDLNSVRGLANGILTRFLDGPEATVDGYKDAAGRLVCLVPRRRLRVRAGEVERAVTFDDPELQTVAAAALNTLQFTGPVTLQAIRPDSGWQVTEINLRFGGGVTLSIEAGMECPRWLIAELAGEQAPTPPKIAWGLGMSRYDEEFYFRTGERAATRR